MIRVGGSQGNPNGKHLLEKKRFIGGWMMLMILNYIFSVVGSHEDKWDEDEKSRTQNTYNNNKNKNNIET